jgi:hypothetical protein
MQAWVDLRSTKNGFFLGEDVTDHDIFAYIWRNHVNFSNEQTFKTWRNKRRVEKFCNKLDRSEKIELIFDHIEEAFLEFPETGSKGGYSRSNALDPVEGCCSAADELAARYGCDPDKVMQWSLCRIFQLQKASRMATIAEYKPLEPQSLRDATSRILEAQNNAKKS